MTRHLGSFPQLLFVAFLLIAALPGGVALHAVSTFDRLMEQSDGFAARALQLSAAAQLLAERSTAMERTARQSLALNDAVLRQRFGQATYDSQQSLAQFQSDDVPAQLIAEWKDKVNAIVASFNGPAESAGQRDAAVAAGFRDLSGINTRIAQEVRHVIDQRRLALQMQMQDSREQLTWLVWVSIGGALLLAVAFGRWLSRPFRRVESAIVGLGENRLAETIAISGPADARRMGRQLEWLRLRLAQLDADKVRFFRHISHELKTPLAALSEGVSLLEDGTTGKLNDDQREVARILKHNTGTLQQQIEALLRFNAAAFEASRLKRAPTDLRALVERQVEDQRLQWKARDIVVTVEGNPLIEPVDPAMLGTAIANLLSNAIRFCKSGGRIAFDLKRHDQLTFIDLRDDGPGVADADRARIFEPFYRGQRQNEVGPRGSGIGLSIVAEYVAAHGGRIVLLAGEPGLSGAHFRIELPHAA